MPNIKNRVEIVMAEFARLASIRLDLQLPIQCAFVTVCAIHNSLNMSDTADSAAQVLRESLRLLLQQIATVSPALAEELEQLETFSEET